jgi:hypothetical protein
VTHYYFFSNFCSTIKKNEKIPYHINSFVWLLYDAKYLLRVEIQIVAPALWKCLLRRIRKIVVKDSHSLKVKHNDCNGKCGRPCAVPSVNTAIPHYNQFEIKSSNFNFSSENKSFINPYPSLLLDMLPSGLFLK